MSTSPPLVMVGTPTAPRRLDYALYGSPEAPHKVIFLAGAGCGRLAVPLNATDLLAQHQVQLICVDRPGIGESDVHPGRSYLDFADDLQRLLAHLMFDKCYLIGHSAGCPHVLAFCSRSPQHVIRAAIVCPPNPLTPPEYPKESFKRSILSFMVRKRPFSTLVNGAVLSMFKSWATDPQKIVPFSLQHAEGKLDKAWLSAEISKDGGKSLLVPFVSGICAHEWNPDAVSQDRLLISQPWPFLLHSINTNIDVWYGLKDSIAPHGHWFCTVLPHATEHAMEERGHHLIMPCFDDIVNELIRNKNH